MLTKDVKKTDAYLILLSIVIFFITLFYIFSSNPLYLFYGEDGHYMVNLIKLESVWRYADLSMANNFLQSIGEIWFPITTRYIPGYEIPSIMFNGEFNQALSYTIFATEFFICGLVISRLIGLTWRASLISAWILPLLSFPIHNYSIMHPVLLLVPHLATIITVTNLILICFLKIGKNSYKYDLLNGALIFILTSYIAIISPAVISVVIPVLFLYCITFIFYIDSTSEKIVKIATSIVIMLSLYISGVIPYIYGLISYTESYFFSKELLNDRISLSNVSLLFQPKIGSILFTLGYIGALYSLFYKRRYYKSLAVAFLSTSLMIVIFGLLTVTFDFWRGPTPITFEFILWPLFIAYSVLSLSVMYVSFSKRLLSLQKLATLEKIFSAQNIAFIFFLLVMFISMSKPVIPEQTYPKNPGISIIVKQLVDEISLNPGDVFHGRVVNMTGRIFNDNVKWATLETNDYSIAKFTGNEHRMNGLWHYNIPTLDVYSPLISPNYYQYTKYLFSKSGDEQVRNIMVLRVPNHKWLKALGVNYIITDAPIESLVPNAKLFLHDDIYLYLYKLQNANLGQYSPTIVKYMDNGVSILNALNNNTFDPAKNVILSDTVDKQLKPAYDVIMRVEKGGAINLTAKSHGKSLILLPLEYSDCLKIVSNSMRNKPRVIRANSIQTAVYFQDAINAKIIYSTGPFNNSRCRLNDSRYFALHSNT